MKKIINGIVYDDSEAANLCYVLETRKIGIDGTEASIELRKTLMRMRKPKAGVLPHEAFKKASFDPKWLIADDEKLEDTGAFFFTLATGRYGGDVIAIVPATPDEARRFVEEHAGYDEYVRHFGCPDGFDMEGAKKVAKAINDANDARDAAKKDLDAETEKLAKANTRLADAYSVTSQQDTMIDKLRNTTDNLNKTLESRNSEITALNEEISRLNDELENLRVVKESPIPTLGDLLATDEHEPDGEEDL